MTLIMNYRFGDLGLEKFLTISGKEFIARPRFGASLYRELELLQRKYARTKKGSSNREKARIKVARCSECGYQTDRDHAASEVIRLRGLECISPSTTLRASTQGLCGIENAYAVGLPGIDESQSRSEAKSPSTLRQAQGGATLRGKTRNA